jgi:hypothetical protein
MIAFADFENTSQKKPLIPNTTKVLKTKKIKKKNKFNPKNVFRVRFKVLVSKQHLQNS